MNYCARCLIYLATYRAIFLFVSDSRFFWDVYIKSFRIFIVKLMYKLRKHMIHREFSFKPSKYLILPCFSLRFVRNFLCTNPPSLTGIWRSELKLILFENGCSTTIAPANKRPFLCSNEIVSLIASITASIETFSRKLLCGTMGDKTFGIVKSA